MRAILLLVAALVGAPAAAQDPAAGPAAMPDEYVLGYGDVLDVRLHYNAELNQVVPIRPDGRISLELIGEVSAAGLTPRALDGELTRLYGATLRQPALTVIVKEIAPRRVYVGGEVNAPGLLPMGASLSALQSIFQAAGVKRSAQLANVVVLRYDGTSQPRFITVDLRAALRPGGRGGDIPLKPLDIVFVPKTRVARLNDFMDQYFRQLAPIPLTLGVSYVFGGVFK